jgi:CheY-like chemotaxis protein
LSNAEKFTPEQGSIQFSANVRKIENDMLTVQIEVADNGIGISKEQQKILFTPFEQADGGMSRKFGGAGLGLTITKYIIDLMGGKIWVESEQGKGSKFTLIFEAQINTGGQTEEGKPISFAGKTALLVDDVEINREIIVAMIEDTGIQIECAQDGREALELFSAEPGKFDIILMDINMPVMDGVEATQRIRALETPGSDQVPILAMTANVLTGEVENYKAVGINDHIGKPVNFDVLINLLRKYLG